MTNDRKLKDQRTVLDIAAEQQAASPAPKLSPYVTASGEIEMRTAAEAAPVMGVMVNGVTANIGNTVNFGEWDHARQRWTGGYVEKPDGSRVEFDEMSPEMVGFSRQIKTDAEVRAAEESISSSGCTLHQLLPAFDLGTPNLDEYTYAKGNSIAGERYTFDCDVERVIESDELLEAVRENTVGAEAFAHALNAGLAERVYDTVDAAVDELRRRHGEVALVKELRCDGLEVRHYADATGEVHAVGTVDGAGSVIGTVR